MTGTVVYSIAFLGLFVSLPFTGLLASPQEKSQQEKQSKNGNGECVKSCQECLIALLICHKKCADLVANGDKSYANCMHSCLDCSEMCRACMVICARKSPMMEILCEACAKTCDHCAKECAKFPDDPVIAECTKKCQQCAESCRNCIKMDNKSN